MGASAAGRLHLVGARSLASVVEKFKIALYISFIMHVHQVKGTACLRTLCCTQLWPYI